MTSFLRRNRLNKEFKKVCGNDEYSRYPSILSAPLGGTHYIVNISQVFGDAYTFDEVIYILGIAQQEDIITFKINSDGGNLYSLVALQNAIKMSKAVIRMELLGMGASAGSALLLTPASEYLIGDNSCLMIHNMLCGVGYDDTHKIVTRASHNEKINERFVRETYKGFLTEEEIEMVLNGREIYLEDFEIRERLSNREKKKEEDYLRDKLDVEGKLSDFSTEELEEEVLACQEDIKMYKKEIKKRKTESDR